MLPSVDSLKQQFLSMPEAFTPIDGATHFVNIIGNYMDQVQAGPTGSPGIFTYLRPPVIAAIAALPPVKDNSWIVQFANAIHLGALGAILVPGTVTLPAVWLVSVVDTLPPVITTLDAALAVLIGSLANVTSANNPPQPLAQAIHDYISAFIFLCTGIGGTVITPVPIPVPIPAQ
jgi:hypothetical protein